MITVPPKISAFINTASKSAGIPANLVTAIIYVESRFNPKATSPKGAMGLGQLMPNTAKNLGVTDPYDPEQNIYGVVKLLSALYSEFGTWRKSVAAYVWGAGNVRKQPDPAKWPQAVKNYVKKVTNAVMQLKNIKPKSIQTPLSSVDNVPWGAIGAIAAVLGFVYTVSKDR